MSGPTPESQRVRYADHRRRGLCVRCNKKANDEKSLCDKHTTQMATSVAKSSALHGKKWRKEGVKRAKDKIFAAYGKRCACCGETIEEFLTIDHVNGDGHIHRHRAGSGTKIGGGGLWRLVAREGCPPKYRILCMNCNHAMGTWGTCPHGTLPPQATNHPANRSKIDPERTHSNGTTKHTSTYGKKPSHDE